MASLAILAVTAFLVTLVITPVCRALCRRFGWVDRPDPRKLHRNPIPRTGGIAIFLGYAAALALARFSPMGEMTVSGAAHSIWTILPALLVAFGTGLIDDLCDLAPWKKVTGQVVAALLVCAAGIEIRGIGGHAITGAWWNVPLTVFWLVACANAFNLIDGLDGHFTRQGQDGCKGIVMRR